MSNSHLLNRLLLVFSLAFLSAWCVFGPHKSSVDSIQKVAEIDANQNTATALDISFIYDANAINLFPKNGAD